ncbi:signal peptidase I [Gilvimarinus sp. DA14]|uniref:signal peptidase I n=1 Tax=Gilvimarinus sp. DA14 TaxID=2956798 RepID=UPI0020B82BC1|nr:signal peptidase I [Gilvimarinus sp. DA14]UTF59060.1 signal peptidase I [Gilvimarinus sp. DA14]
MKIGKWVKANRGIILFLFGMAFFRTAVADWNYVPSGSMEPTLYPGDVLVVNKLAYGPAVPFTRSRLWSTGEPSRGDVITFFPSHTDQCLVKRVVGVPGDRLRFAGSSIWLNGERLTIEEKEGALWQNLTPLLAHKVQLSTSDLATDTFNGEFVVPEGKYFVMGDNRHQSYDSRYWGFVDKSQVVGKVAAVGLSLSDRFVERFASDVL